MKNFILERFKLCTDTDIINYNQALMIFSVVFKQFRISAENLKLVFRCGEYQGIPKLQVRQILKCVNRARFLITRAHNEFELFNKMEIERAKNLKMASIEMKSPPIPISTTENEDVFTRLAKPKEAEYENYYKVRFYKKEMPKHNKTKSLNIKKFVDECMNRIIPNYAKDKNFSKPLILKLDDKSLEISKKHQNNQIFERSIKLIKQSMYHKDSNIRAFAYRLMKGFQKDKDNNQS